MDKTAAEEIATLGQLLREKREREGLSLREAGAACGIAFSTLGRIENGAEPSLRVDRAARAWLNGEGPLLPMPPMALRDWFAGQAISGIEAKGASYPPETVARDAYALADALIAERAKGQPHA